MGASEHKLREITTFATSPHYSAAERAALAYAEAMTITGQKVTDELFAEVRRHFSEAQVVELTAAVALENFRSKFNVALGIESQGFCVRPPRERTLFVARTRGEAADGLRPSRTGCNVDCSVFMDSGR